MSEALADNLPFGAEKLPEGRIPSLTNYRMLGKTGLRIFPLAYSVGTFSGAVPQTLTDKKANPNANRPILAKADRHIERFIIGTPISFSRKQCRSI